MIVRGRALVGNRWLREVDILVDEQGRIGGIGVAGSLKGEVLDYSRPGLVILPGLIDVHVHMRDLEYSYKEDFLSGTAAAAAGGYVVVCDMPNTKPPTNTPRALEMKLRAAGGKAIVDYGLYYGVPPALEGLDDAVGRIVGFKVYPEDLAGRREVVGQLLGYAASRGLPVVFHPEDPSLFTKGPCRPGEERPPEAEASAIRLVGRMLDAAGGARVHITHVSSLAGLGEALALKRRWGRLVTIDVTPHHMLLDNSLYRLNPAMYKVYPPLRERLDCLGLCLAVRDGQVDIVATDHAPHAAEEKAGSYEEALPGYSSLEVAASILLTMVANGLLSLARLVELCSQAPARLIGLEGVLGVIHEGAYASFTVVDLRREWKVDPSAFYSKAKHCPYEGWRLRGRPVATIVRGRVVYDEAGVDLGLRGWGRNVRSLA